MRDRSRKAIHLRPGETFANLLEQLLTTDQSILHHGECSSVGLKGTRLTDLVLQAPKKGDFEFIRPNVDQQSSDGQWQTSDAVNDNTVEPLQRRRAA